MAASNDASTPSFSMYRGLHFGSHICEANSEMALHFKRSLYRMRRNARPLVKYLDKYLIERLAKKRFHSTFINIKKNILCIIAFCARCKQIFQAHNENINTAAPSTSTDSPGNNNNNNGKQMIP